MSPVANKKSAVRLPQEAIIASVSTGHFEVAGKSRESKAAALSKAQESESSEDTEQENLETSRILEPQEDKRARNAKDLELVKRTLDGDRLAYRELFDVYRPRALSVAYNILRSREDAEDVVQESFVKAYLALSGFKGDSAFYTWFFRIVYNMAIDFKRKFARRGEDEKVEYQEEFLNSSADQTSYHQKSSTSPFDQLLVREQMALVQGALSKLSEDHRTVITLREVDGLSYDEIAEVTGVSKGTVMSRLHYARKELQNSLVTRERV
ncbi:MAG: sigma-70 family RNA polymerase sigma factor [Bdellovibrionales bacterium]|nr:sigma-70 family RNA polymerase sigma factor [Bdellovibrionales bacterium]